MRYELLLQRPPAAETFDAERVARVLAEKGEQAGRWQLPAGAVEVVTVREGGAAIAISLGVPISDKTELVRAMLEAGVEVAGVAEVVLFDPQLMRPVAAADVEAVAEQFLRTARYAGEMLGIPEAIGASFAPPPQTGLKSGTKVLLGLVGFFVLLYLVLEGVLSRLG